MVTHYGPLPITLSDPESPQSPYFGEFWNPFSYISMSFIVTVYDAIS